MDQSRPGQHSPREPARWRHPALVWLALALGLAAMFGMDGWVMALVRPLHESASSDYINRTVRHLGTGQVQAGALLLMVIAGFALSACCLWGRRLAAAGGWGVASLSASGLAATVLKVVIHRPRPWFTPPDLSGWKAYFVLAMGESKLRSFPSGETATSFAVAWTICHFFPRLRWPLLGVAGLVGVARVLVGAHHPSDVWAGAMVGLAAAQWVTGLARRRRQEAREAAAMEDLSCGR